MSEDAKKQLQHVGILLAAILVTVFVVFQIFNGDSSTSSTANQNSVEQENAAQQEEAAPQAPAATINEDGTMVSYGGQEGRSALEILKELTEPTTEDSSFGEFVSAINGVDGDGQKYWLFYVDGEAATVGAAEYVTSDGETIEWRLE